MPARQFSFQVSAKRPTIPISFGGKVPSNIRQRYLNIFIDECLKIYPDQKDAFDRVSYTNEHYFSLKFYQKIVVPDYILTT